MRKFIIDTDTASDDAAAIMLAAFSKDVEVLGITAVAGNVNVKQAALNAKMTSEVCSQITGKDIPVYVGQARPLFKERKETISVHGNDGMGDCDIIHPKGKLEDQRAVDFILETVAKYPDEVELVVLGPATNVALAILTDREVMKKVKHIWSMGTPGFAIGNATPVAEFNVYLDAEAYSLMLDCGVPVTIIGFDMCEGDIVLDDSELARLREGNAAGKFLERATSQLYEFKKAAYNMAIVDLPDAVALASAILPGFVKSSVRCNVFCCTSENETYGQVIFYREGRTYEAMPKTHGEPVEVVTAVDEKIFTDTFMKMLTE